MRSGCPPRTKPATSPSKNPDTTADPLVAYAASKRFGLPFMTRTMLLPHFGQAARTAGRFCIGKRALGAETRSPRPIGVWAVLAVPRVGLAGSPILTVLSHGVPRFA